MYIYIQAYICTIYKWKTKISCLQFEPPTRETSFHARPRRLVAIIQSRASRVVERIWTPVSQKYIFANRKV